MTANDIALLVPPAVVTVMFCGPNAAVGPMAKVAVIWESVTAPTVAVTPAGTFSVVAPVRFTPVRVTGTLVPITPVRGAMAESVGSATGNVTPRPANSVFRD